MRGEEGIRGVGQTADRQSRVGGAKLVLRLVQGDRERERELIFHSGLQVMGGSPGLNNSHPPSVPTYKSYYWLIYS